MLGNHHPNRSNASNLSSNIHTYPSETMPSNHREEQQPTQKGSTLQRPYQASLLPESANVDSPMPEASRNDAKLQQGEYTETDLFESTDIEDAATIVDEQLAALGLGDPTFAGSGDPSTSTSSTEVHGMAFAAQVWRNALSELALNMPPATFDTWMKSTRVIGYEDGEFIIGAPNAYACDWIKGRLRNQIKRTLCRLLQRQSIQVTFRVVSSSIDEPSSESTPLYDLASARAGAPVQDDLSKENESKIDAEGEEHQAFGRLAQQASEHSVAHTANSQNSMTGNRMYSNESGNSISIKLNKHHTFDTFVVGKHNRMAHAAAEAISDNPGASFNPLFVYGGVGLGKTHLLHAIGNRAVKKGFHILYCTSEQFTNELILAIRNQSTETFRNKYRQVDILLIDDIQFIGGKESTQEEFFHTFNHLHAAGKQVILSSDRPPKALPTLEERLRSRFEGGLQTDISKPDFETRVAILQSKAAKVNMNIEPAALMLIAERVDSNIRELEGALNRIVHQAKFFSNQLDTDLTEAVLKNLAPERTLRTPAAIVEVVAEHYALTVEDIKGRSRTKDIAHARQMAMYLLREENAMSLPAIGDLLGGRDHSTVRHGVEKIVKDLENSETVQSQVIELREKIYAAPGI